MQVCEKCADRAAQYATRALASLPYAQRTLETIRLRLRAYPPAAVFLAAGRAQEDLFESSLTAQDLSRILAHGTAIAALRTRTQDGYWLSVRGAVEQGGVAHTFVLVAQYAWPPPEHERWPLLLTRVFETGRWHSPDGYPLCWCNHAKEDDHDVY